MPNILINTSTAGDDDLIAWITIDNEARLNCINTTLARQLTAALEQLAEEPALRAVCIEGAGRRAFIGGADIREMAALNTDTAGDFIRVLHQVCATIRALQVPVIARISGYCLGAGLEIAASCDLRIADTSASFAMPEVRIGLPSVIEAALLPRLIGWGRAARMVYSGEHIDAETAQAWGLVEELTAPDNLRGAVETLLAAIAQADPAAVRMQKQLLRDWAALPLDAAIDASMTVFPRAFAGPQPRQRMQAFLNRKPK